MIEILFLLFAENMTITCDFDGSACVFYQDHYTDDLIDWRVNSGKTGTAHTGPEQDHTTTIGQFSKCALSQGMR